METETVTNPYYGRTYILWEMAKCLDHRYLSMKKLKKDRTKTQYVRYLLGYTPQLIITSVKHYGGFEKDNQYYFDLTTWSDEMPMFSFDKEKRDIQKIEFDENWQKYFKGYDLAIDIDGINGDVNRAYKDSMEIKAFFDKFKIPYSVKFSGSKGFHFYTPYKYLPKNIKPVNLPERCGKVTDWIKDLLNLKCIDVGIYDHRRVLKLPYSCVKDKVCLPLDDQQFNNFKVEDMSISNVLNKIFIKDRGLLIRTHGLTEKQLCQNMAELFKKAR